ncbi:hypothetical protein JYU14_00170 [Simkania negevensis]|uniref:Outer membrane lipoprotein BamD-like domain-containing protein n=1 Tax=Simkania negevensis TaxID=83561 RepID=A0ABS3APC4_9BACT|nr:hypothetical protein [Simkania negevensis]
MRHLLSFCSLFFLFGTAHAASIWQEDVLPSLYEEYPQVFYMLGHSFYTKEEYDKAAHYLNSYLSTDQVSQEHKKTSLLMLMASTYHQKKWEESYLTFLEFSKHFPDSKQQQQVARIFLESALHLLEIVDSTAPISISLRKQVADDIRSTLAQSNPFSDDETRSYLLKEAKILYDIGLFQTALDTLSPLLNPLAEEEGSYQVHYLAALCYNKLGGDPALFIKHAKKTLSLQPALPEKRVLHLNLFNAYLQQANSGKGPQEEKSLAQAANHLHTAIKDAPYTLDERYILWLANHYHNIVAQAFDASSSHSLDTSLYIHDADRAINLFNHLLRIDEHGEAEAIASAKDLFLEPELLKLCKLFRWKKQGKKAITLLEQLRSLQEGNPRWPWAFVSTTLLQLAKTYETEGKMEQGIDVLTKLLSMHLPQGQESLFEATLLLARMKYRLLPSDKKYGGSEMTGILDMLKEVQIQKNIQHEPLHLEAAFDYAQYNATREQDEEARKGKFLFLLKKMKEDFSLEEDIVAKNYHTERRASQEKNVVYQSYMTLLDAHIASIESQQAYRQGNLLEAKRKEEAARNFLQAIGGNDNKQTEYLAEKREQLLQQLSR